MKIALLQSAELPFDKAKLNYYLNIAKSEGVKLFVLPEYVLNRFFKEIEKIINYLEKLNLKKCSLTKFEFKKKGFLAIYIGDFFYRIKLNKQNKIVLLIVRKKIEENPKSLLFKSLISIDKKEKTFLNIDNLKHYLKTLKKNDKLYKSEKIKKFYENKNILNLLKETFE